MCVPSPNGTRKTVSHSLHCQVNDPTKENCQRQTDAGIEVIQTNYLHTSVDDHSSSSSRCFPEVFSSRHRSTLQLWWKAVMQWCTDVSEAPQSYPAMVETFFTKSWAQKRLLNLYGQSEVSEFYLSSELPWDSRYWGLLVWSSSVSVLTIMLQIYNTLTPFYLYDFEWSTNGFSKFPSTEKLRAVRNLHHAKQPRRLLIYLVFSRQQLLGLWRRCITHLTVPALQDRMTEHVDMRM